MPALPRSRSRGDRSARPSAVVRPARGFRWRGIAAEPYAPERDRASRVARYVLFAGSRGVPISFDVRYFEIEPGGYSAHETHRHAHVVLGVRGAGVVRIGRRRHHLRRWDACYIGPATPHQLSNEGRRPFGFLCIVDAQRDAGRPVAAAPTARPVRKRKRRPAGVASHR